MREDNTSVLVIDVADTGIGIPPERQAAIFEVFVQADAGTAGRFGGTGLGLSISGRLAALMDGALTLRSEIGHGSCFTLTLPLSPAVQSMEAENGPEPAGRPAAAGMNPCWRVLVAEDHDINQILVTAMLERLDCEVSIASNGEQAVSMVASAREMGRQYDLVLMDSQMPVLDGLAASRRIRAAGITPSELPIVALTANAFADDIAASLAAGMQAHIAKPVTLGQLEDALQRWGGVARTAPKPETAIVKSGSVQDRYRVRKQETLTAVNAMVRRGNFTNAELKSVAELLHKLAGTAGMFGETELGERARALETGLEQWSAGERNRRIAKAAKALLDAA